MAELPAPGLAAPDAAEAELAALVGRALAEDIGAGDVTTTATVPAELRAQALITQKAPGVIYGMEAAGLAFTLLDPEVQARPEAQEGVWREGGPVMSVHGSARALLTGERTALNFLAHLSGIATMAAQAARELQGTGSKLLDTRKTTPGLRALEKQAVRAGGGFNHRAGLYDAILIKENHIAAAGGIAAALERARAQAPGLADSIAVEVRDADEIEQALAAGAPRLLLDNMDEAALRAAVELVDGRAELEASGGVTLATLRTVAGTGVEWISVGAITHSAPALDLSLQLTALP
jgi:nicotinate-nucleotide pyrophosphorylase (carboxylating)